MSSTNITDGGIVGSRVNPAHVKEGPSSKRKFFSLRTVALILLFALLSFILIRVLSQSPVNLYEVSQQSPALNGYFCPPRRSYHDQNSGFGIYVKAFIASMMLIVVSHRAAGYLLGVAVRYSLCTIPGSFQVITFTTFPCKFHLS